jgi:transposase
VEAEVFNANGRTVKHDKANGRYYAISQTNPNKIGNVRTTLTLNPLNSELNPICQLLAFLEAHNILHVSRIRVNPLTWKIW